MSLWVDLGGGAIRRYLQFTVDFSVAGWRYYNGESVIHRVQCGDPVSLESQASNPVDSGALRVLLGSTHVGYVPAIYAWNIDESVVEGRDEASALRVGQPDDPQHRLWVSVVGETLFGFSGDLSEDLRKQEELLYR